MPGLGLVRGVDGRPRGEHPAVARLGQVRQPGGLVHRVADDRVLVAFGGADVAGDDGPDRHSDAGRQLAVVQQAGHLPRGRERGAGRVVEVQRGAEDAQRRVADELVDQPTVVLRRLDDGAEELVQRIDDLGGRAVDGETGRADDVDEQRRGEAFLPAETHPLLECLAGDVRPDLAAEQVAQPFALAQPRGHPVEAGRGEADLGGVEDRYPDVEVARLDVGERVAHVLQRVGDRPRERAHRQCPHRDGHAGQHAHRAGQVVGGDVGERREEGERDDPADRHHTERPGEVGPRSDPGHLVGSRRRVGQHPGHPGAQQPLRLQVGQARGGRAAEGDGHDDLEAVQRPDGEGQGAEDDGGQRPQAGLHPQQAHRQPQDRVPGRRVRGRVGAVEVQHRPRQPQPHGQADRDGDEHVDEGDGRGPRRQPGEPGVRPRTGRQREHDGEQGHDHAGPDDVGQHDRARDQRP